MDSNQPVYCTYLRTSTKPNLTLNPRNMLTRQDQSELPNEEESYNIPTDTDIIYASYANQLMAYTNQTIANMRNYCDQPNFISCFSNNQCIAQDKWCDSTVDCVDGSDETACSCKSRLSKDKICDGYHDCPMGSDEIGCFGCDKFSYSCYRNRMEFIDAKKSSMSMCFSIIEKCDGTENCLNGRDERECSMNVRSIGQHLVS